MMRLDNIDSFFFKTEEEEENRGGKKGGNGLAAAAAAAGSSKTCRSIFFRQNIFARNDVTNAWEKAEFFRVHHFR
jgi:hypothetical protein